MKRQRTRTEKLRRSETAPTPPLIGTGKAGALEEFLNLVPFLYHRLRAITQALHGEGEFSGARRSVLRSLATGPATVPHLARARPVARQVMQRLVNDLAQSEFVEFVDNPHHERSKLVRITAAGRASLKDMLERERDMDASLVAELTEPALRTAADVTRTLIVRLAQVSAKLPNAPPARRRTRSPEGAVKRRKK